ncbi:hypothetical protein BDQ17DRAFT_1393360 [Cyathus striatus]|nr:hypothetical protein BDQ17DRAFT_1393360 [Cyathus striatus]
MSDTPLDTFFTKYESEGKYKYNKNTPINEEFGNCQAYHQVRLEYRNAAYGTDLNDLNAWKHLCQIIGINPVPEKLKECRKAVKKTNVNLMDLLETKRTGDLVTVFESQKALSVYTKRTGKYFPKEQAHAGGILKYLLRKINNPYMKGPSAGGDGGGR